MLQKLSILLKVSPNDELIKKDRMILKTRFISDFDDKHEILRYAYCD